MQHWQAEELDKYQAMLMLEDAPSPPYKIITYLPGKILHHLSVEKSEALLPDLSKQGIKGTKSSGRHKMKQLNVERNYLSQ